MASRSDDVLRTLHSLSWAQLTLVVGGLVLGYNVVSFVYRYWHRSRSPLRLYPGPKEPGHWLWGHLRMMLASESQGTLERWIREYGPVITFRGMLGSRMLITTDLRANTHILFAAHTYTRAPENRRALQTFVGEGLLYTIGEQHREQRRLLNPAFGFSHVREMTDIFLEKGAQMREIWYNMCLDAGGSVQLNALAWLSKATLDVVGKAGFDYEFNTLDPNGTPNEMAEAFDKLFRTDLTAVDQIHALVNQNVPILQKLFPGSRARMQFRSKKLMDTIGMKIIQDKKAAILADLGGQRSNIDKKAIGGKDVISLLLQANLAQDATSRMTDEEVLAQIPTFLLAGHETTSNATTWAMYALATHPDMQTRLREEMMQIPTETPNLDQLNALPFLDNVVREVLRLYAVVSSIGRAACEDDVIPLSKPIKDRNGNMVTEIRIQKGDQVQVPIWLVNRSKEIWGPDAEEFRPDRWNNPPHEAAAIPGIAPNTLAFIGGPRACIGFRFALAEMKSLLFHIVRGFEFKLAVPKDQIWSRSGVLMRAQRRDNNKVELPVILTPAA